MRQRIEATDISNYRPQGKIPSPLRGKVLRLLDQAEVDGDDIGSCQTVAIAAAIEGHTGNEFSYDYLSRWYKRLDRIYNGRAEKLSRAVRFAGVGMGRARLINIEKLPSKDYSYEKLVELVKRKDGVAVTVSLGGGFFSKVSGNFYNSFSIPGAGHAMRVFWNDGLWFQNSWAGWVLAKLKPSDDIKFWEIYGFDIVEE